MKTIDQLRYEFGEASGGTIEDYVYQYMQAELHEYGTTLQGKIIDLTYERDEFDEANKKLVAERKQIIEHNASMDLKNTLLEDDIKKLNQQVHSQQELIELQETKIQFLEPYKDQYESAIIEGDLLRTKNEELQEGFIEVKSDYKDVCELSSVVFDHVDKVVIMDLMSPQDYERLKNHIGV